VSTRTNGHQPHRPTGDGGLPRPPAAARRRLRSRGGRIPPAGPCATPTAGPPRLVATVRRQRKQSRLVQSTLASLRQLQPVEP